MSKRRQEDDTWDNSNSHDKSRRRLSSADDNDEGETVMTRQCVDDPSSSLSVLHDGIPSLGPDTTSLVSLTDFDVAWRFPPQQARKYPLGTRIRQRYPERKKGVVRGHRNELDNMGHTTGRTINWVVYKKEGTCDEFTDDEISLFNPKCPKERWEAQTREHPVGTLIRKTFNDVEYIGCVQGHVFHWNWIVYSDGGTEELNDVQVNSLRINDDDNCNGKTVSDKCERNTNDMAVSDENKRKDKAKENDGGKEKEADAKPSVASLPQIETKSSNIVTIREDSCDNRERRFRLGTVVSQQFGKKVKQGVIRGYRDEFGTGRTINWVVFDEFGYEMYDDAIKNPEIPESWNDVKVRKYPVGTLVRKMFSGRYYLGTVQGHCDQDGPENGLTLNWIVYEDYDTEEMLDEDVKAHLFTKKAGAVFSGGKSIVPEKDVSDVIRPDGAPSSFSSDSVIPKELNGFVNEFDVDSQIKIQGLNSLSAAARNRIAKVTKKWIVANTDPQTKRGRFVFRHKQTKGTPGSITTVLGGNGAYPWTTSKKDNLFIRPGEFYVAENKTLNPYGPRFPGDSGMVNSEALELNPNQEEFHMFVQCSDSPTGRLWQGKDAKNGRLYVGVYKVPEDAVETTVRFAELPEASRRCLAEFFYKRQAYSFYAYPNGKIWSNEHRVKAQEIIGQWESLSESEKDIAAFETRLVEEDYQWDMTTIEFVRYDEGLYKSLVDAGAHTTNRKSMFVSLDPTELGRSLK